MKAYNVGPVDSTSFSTLEIRKQLRKMLDEVAKRLYIMDISLLSNAEFILMKKFNHTME